MVNSPYGQTCDIQSNQLFADDSVNSTECLHHDLLTFAGLFFRLQIDKQTTHIYEVTPNTPSDWIERTQKSMFLWNSCFLSMVIEWTY